MKSKLSSFYISSILLCNTFNIIKSEHETDTMTTKAVNANAKIKLFVYNECPWCNKVIDFLKQMGQINKITIMNLELLENMQELKNLNLGNTQAPYLFDEPKGIKILESADIINYLTTRF